MKRALNWATEQGHVRYSPIAKTKRPPIGVRVDILTADEYSTLLNLIPDQRFKDLPAFSWEVGARPQEAKAIRTDHVA